MYEWTIEKLNELFGLVPLPGWKTDLPAAIAAICAEYKVPPGGFEAGLAADPVILRRLAGCLTVGETYFLRDSYHFDRILNHLIGIYHAEQNRPLIWSAGCASGEEPYSLAIMLARLAPELGDRARIIASDLNREALDRARRGIYRQWSFRSAPPWLLRDHFVGLEGHEWQLDNGIRGRVEFFEESLQERLAQFRESSVDCILFRNVAIYFDPLSTHRIHEQFVRILKPNGLLVQSAGDGRPSTQLFQPRYEGEYGLFTPGSNSTEIARDPLALQAPPVFPSEEPAKPISKPKRQPRRASTLAVPAAAHTNEPAKYWGTTEKPVEQRLRQALSLGDQGRLDEAIRETSSLLEAHPHESPVRLARGQLFLAAGHYQEALSDLRRLIFEQPDHITGRYWLAVSLRMIGLPKQAALQLQDLTRRLAGLAPACLLDDGKTTAGELANAIVTDLRMLQ